MLPFFSIITPVYNCQKYIRKCIESVLEQTYGSWELILVDDGSTDASGAICDSFSYDARVKVIHQVNAGALESRIKGISAASGIYALGLDADDYLENNCLEVLRKAVDVSHSDVILFGYRFVGRQRGEMKCLLAPGKCYPRKEILKEVIGQTNHSLWNKVIKLDKMRKADYSGLRKKLSINLDYAQIIPILCEIDTGYVIGDVLYNYRISGNSISHSCKVQHIIDTGYVTGYVLHKLKKCALLDHEMRDETYRAYLRMIGFRLYQLFKNKKISNEDCRVIRKSAVYKASKRVETMECLGKSDFIVMRLFRYKQYWVIRLIAELQGMYRA